MDELEQEVCASDCLHLGWLKVMRPDIYDRVLQEYQRVGGVIPYETGYVYAIQACGSNFYKLGKTSNPDRRILQIAPQMPFPTRYIKVWRTNFMTLAERWLHEYFADNRTNGEWFDFDKRMAAGFFCALDLEFDEQIRNAYGSYFFDSVIRDEAFSEKFRAVISSSIFVDMGWWGGSANTIAWIDNLFAEAARTEFPLPDDFARLCRDALREADG